MNLRRIDLNLLPVLEALYIERNLTRAAERVGLSQPAMSNALSRLRATLEDELFVRQGRTMQPTPKARQVALATQKALDLVREGVTAPATFNPSEKRTFRLCGSEHVEFLIAPLMTMQLGDDIENVNIRVSKPVPGEETLRLKSGEVDLVIDYQVPDDPELTSMRLVDDRLICLMRHDHPFDRDTLEIEDLGQLKHVAPEVAVNRFFLDVFLRSKGITRDIVVRSPTVISMPILVENSDLICTMSELLADVITRHDRFRRFPAPIPDPTFPLFLIWHNTRDSDPANMWLREFVRDICVGFHTKFTAHPSNLTASIEQENSCS